MEAINNKLPLLENKKKSLEVSLSEFNGNLSPISKDLALIIEKINFLEERWLELSELDP